MISHNPQPLVANPNKQAYIDQLKRRAWHESEAASVRFEILYALMVFCFVAAITPGPNNLMLLASGVNFGFQRTIPHMMGVGLGFALMVGLVGVGLDAVFWRFPALLPTMRYAGAAYMLWLAARLALAGPIGDAQYSGSPLSFRAALQKPTRNYAWMRLPSVRFPLPLP